MYISNIIRIFLNSLYMKRFDEMLEQDPKRKLNANEIQSKLESILCTDLSVHKQSIRSYVMFQRSRDIDLTVISDTVDREDEVIK